MSDPSKRRTPMPHPAPPRMPERPPPRPVVPPQSNLTEAAQKSLREQAADAIDLVRVAREANALPEQKPTFDVPPTLERRR